MDNDLKEPEASTLPRAVLFPSTSSATGSSDLRSLNSSPDPTVEGEERTGVFVNLVKGDGDIAGLVAYSIYKQNKLDWLRAVQTTLRRSPTEAELASYIIGEGTPRRLATYRHLAEATLAGHGPNIGENYAGPTAIARGRSVLARRSLFSPGLIGLYALIAVLFVVGFALALHYTMTTR